MNKLNDLEHKIFQIRNEKEFNDIAIFLFHYHYNNNKIYRQFVDNMTIAPVNEVKHYLDIPFLPIEFFKQHKVRTFAGEPETIFTSSSTTGTGESKHYVKKLEIYEKSFILSFENFFGKIKDCVLLALLPSYLERKGSSLIFMTEKLIQLTNNRVSGFYLNNYDELLNKLEILKRTKQKTILIGVSFALLDIAEKYRLNFPELSIIETGGMKGRRKEIIREDLHSKISKAFGTNKIHSEYGMTELLSQAYSLNKGLFKSPPWMKVLIRDINDPLAILKDSSTGGINIIDLANIYSCPFIATQDLGKLHQKESFEVLGRFDHSDTRGCNLMFP